MACQLQCFHPYPRPPPELTARATSLASFFMSGRSHTCLVYRQV